MSDRTSPKVSSFPDTAMPTVSCQSLQTAYTSPKNLMRLIFLSAYECGSPMLSSSFGEMSPSFGGMSTLMCLGLYNLQLGFLKSWTYNSPIEERWPNTCATALQPKFVTTTPSRGIVMLWFQRI
ncbi:uncharacterized protein LOC117106134 isoform X1 [Anneissia japonica]|uniref:uncharacterized protein LOC117106134 isoform X1 n=1 Tax=Anneissia japonica TaxID=1529436 RepID=UPI0014255282|nr:uncharacterized protein LOC117106134 isoform X1 [Anneissia japonica]